MIESISIDRNDKGVCLHCSTPPTANPGNPRIPASKTRAHCNLPGGAALPRNLAGRVLQVGLRVIERTLREQCPDVPPAARYGGETYIHRFGSVLNAHLHYHSCMIDGLFAQTEEGLQFYEVTRLSDEAIHQAQEKIRKRVLRLFVRRGLLS